MKNLIICKNKVEYGQLATIKTPQATDSFQPVPHHHLVDLTRTALERAGLSIVKEEHGTARDGMNYFGGFAIIGQDIQAKDRMAVMGLRNSHVKQFSASLCGGNTMLTCENLSFMSDVRLDRRHTSKIMQDLERLIADGVGRIFHNWNDMTARIDKYKETEIPRQRAADLLVDLVDCKAFPARDIYNAIQEFRNPRHDEFKGGSLWTLYNSITENLKGGDLSKLPFRTMTVHSIFDRISGHKSAMEEIIPECDGGDDESPLVVALAN